MKMSGGEGEGEGMKAKKGLAQFEIGTGKSGQVKFAMTSSIMSSVETIAMS